MGLPVSPGFQCPTRPTSTWSPQHRGGDHALDGVLSAVRRWPDKKLRPEHFTAARWDTAAGAVLTQLVMAAVCWWRAAATIGPRTPRPASTRSAISARLTPYLAWAWAPGVRLGIVGARMSPPSSALGRWPGSWARSPAYKHSWSTIPRGAMVLCGLCGRGRGVAFWWGAPPTCVAECRGQVIERPAPAYPSWDLIALAVKQALPSQGSPWRCCICGSSRRWRRRPACWAFSRPFGSGSGSVSDAWRASVPDRCGTGTLPALPNGLMEPWTGERGASGSLSSLQEGSRPPVSGVASRRRTSTVRPRRQRAPVRSPTGRGWLRHG